VLRGEETIPECGRRLLDEVITVASGKLTQAERLGHYAFAIGKIAA
jgi:altronate dehydratase large subunit